MAEKPVKIFVGCAPNGEDAESVMVLEYTLRKFSSLPLDITQMCLSRDGRSTWSGWETAAWATPFSGLRWAIPAACRFKGRAIYLDSDMIALADIAELWNAELEPGKVVMAKGGGSWRFCASLWDCAAAKEHMLPLAVLKGDPGSHKAMMAYFQKRGDLVQAFPEGANWNWLDTGNETTPIEDARLVHYTDMAAQPHIKYAAPRLAAAGARHWYDGGRRPNRVPEVVALFEGMYAEALAAGYRVEDYVPATPYGDFRKASLTNYRAAKS